MISNCFETQLQEQYGLQTTSPTALKKKIGSCTALYWARRKYNYAAPSIVSWLWFCHRQTESLRFIGIYKWWFQPPYVINKRSRSEYKSYKGRTSGSCDSFRKRPAPILDLHRSYLADMRKGPYLQRNIYNKNKIANHSVQMFYEYCVTSLLLDALAHCRWIDQITFSFRWNMIMLLSSPALKKVFRTSACCF